MFSDFTPRFIAIMPLQRVDYPGVLSNNVVVPQRGDLGAAGHQVHFAADAQEFTANLTQAGKLRHTNMKSLVDGVHIPLATPFPLDDRTQLSDIPWCGGFAQAPDDQLLERNTQEPDFTDRSLVQFDEPVAALGNYFDDTIAIKIQQCLAHRCAGDSQRLGKSAFGKELAPCDLAIPYRATDCVIPLLGKTFRTNQAWY